MPDPDATRQEPPPDPDLMAAVVLHVLVTKGREGLGVNEVAVETERDPRKADEREEVEQALAILVRDDLATREDDHWKPTTAAIRAAELSF